MVKLTWWCCSCDGRKEWGGCPLSPPGCWPYVSAAPYVHVTHRYTQADRVVSSADWALRPGSTHRE